MSEFDDGVTRRKFIQATTIAAAGAAAFPYDSAVAQTAAPAAAKYTRYNMTSPNGQRALASYARGVEAMLKLPADHPQNWFRNAFIHLMDCPHGNWWFYVWHRGYVGFFEETIRNLSGDPTFAMPYWDWTQVPRIPAPMFDGPLNPQNAPFSPYTFNFAQFTTFLKPALVAYWKTLSSDQLAQLNLRGYPNFDSVWDSVDGFDPGSGNGISGNIAYATTCGSRYLTRDNPSFDKKTAYDVSAPVIVSGLAVKEYWNADITLSFTSSRTTSHMIQPGASTQFSILEGLPHNNVHNYIGGVGPLDPGPYGNMTNFLSPVDPIFFLHHANMDRLWYVWTNKQKRLGLPILPSGADLDALSKEPFLFYVNGQGKYVGPSRAGDYLSTERFNYDYEPATGDAAPAAAATPPKTRPRLSLRAEMKGTTASVTIPRDAVREHLASAQPSLIAEVRVQRPHSSSHSRAFDVIVGAPEGVTEVDADSPHYAGTIAFFGPVHHHDSMSDEASFAVPLPARPEAFGNLEAANVGVNIRVIPAQRRGKPPVLKGVSVRTVQ